MKSDAKPTNKDNIWYCMCNEQCVTSLCKRFFVLVNEMLCSLTMEFRLVVCLLMHMWLNMALVGNCIQNIGMYKFSEIKPLNLSELFSGFGILFY